MLILIELQESVKHLICLSKRANKHTMWFLQKYSSKLKRKGRCAAFSRSCWEVCLNCKELKIFSSLICVNCEPFCGCYLHCGYIWECVHLLVNRLTEQCLAVKQSYDTRIECRGITRHIIQQSDTLYRVKSVE